VSKRFSLQHLLEHDRWIVAAALAAAVAISAVFILSGGGTGMSAIGMSIETGPPGALLAGSPDMISAQAWTLWYGLVIFFMWWMMMVAMMVPSAAPAILLYSALNRTRGSLGALEFLSGYLVAWAAFSLAITLVQALLAALGLMSAMYMNLATPYLAALVLIGAGLYQLTPVKAACLDNCRDPIQALTRHRRKGRAAAFRMGLIHGAFCVGCCWALMVLLFVGGVMNIWWITAIAVYVAVEKLASRGRRLARMLAVALIVAGIALLVGQMTAAGGIWRAT
jgi:predicted metal-binding membrane protein